MARIYTAIQFRRMMAVLREQPPKPGEHWEQIARRVNPLLHESPRQVRKARRTDAGSPDRRVLDDVLSAAGFQRLEPYIDSFAGLQYEGWRYPIALPGSPSINP